MSRTGKPGLTVRSLIRQGEHQQLDFKHSVTDSKKIARTLSAFANTDGGTLLLGVRDNGSIAGVKSEEEYYMIEAASNIFCRPAIQFRMQTHSIDKRTILEVNVMKGNNRPYLALDDNGKWLAYVRKNDQNLLANRVILKVWKLNKEEVSILVKFRREETELLKHLREYGSITLSRFRKKCKISSSAAERILASFIVLGIIEYNLTEKECRYFPSSNFGDAETRYFSG